MTRTSACKCLEVGTKSFGSLGTNKVEVSANSYYFYYHTFILSTYTGIHTYTQTHTHTHTRVHTYIYTHIHTYTHAYIHTHVHTYIHTYIHTHARTYIRGRTQNKPDFLKKNIYLHFLQKTLNPLQNTLHWRQYTCPVFFPHCVKHLWNC